MPKITPQCRCCAAEQPLPQPRAQQKRQIKSQPQLAPAQGEGAVQPRGKELQTDQKLTQTREFPVERPEHIRRRPQKNPLQEASRQPLPDHLRGHRRHPRRGFGSS